MSSLAAANITKFHGPQLVLQDVTLVVPDGARIGLVGPNGAGKSTLLRILAGLEEPDSGTVRRSPRDLTVGYLAQEHAARNLSGGESARAQLAELTDAQYDVVLLDEPTNDLDFAGLEGLERFLRELRGAAVIVSHDREFLDRTVTRIVELDEWKHGAREFAGGWSDYERARDLSRRRQYDAYEAFENEKERLQRQLNRMREWERHGYGQGRKKKKTKDVKSAIGGRINRLDAVEKPYEPWELQLEFGGGRRSGDIAVRLKEAVVERGDFRLGPIDLELAYGDRLAVSGGNGTGKTTLLHALLGDVVLSSGTRWIGPGVVVGELAQERSEFAGGVLLDEFVHASSLPAEAARTLLAKFGLGADDVRRDTRSLSPGERTRAGLALLAALGVNFLVLDEPTNHLDIPAIEELERALESFVGTIVLVTHDRRFRERFRATRTLELQSSRARAARAVPR